MAGDSSAPVPFPDRSAACSTAGSRSGGSFHAHCPFRPVLKVFSRREHKTASLFVSHPSGGNPGPAAARSLRGAERGQPGPAARSGGDGLCKHSPRRDVLCSQKQPGQGCAVQSQPGQGCALKDRPGRDVLCSANTARSCCLPGLPNRERALRLQGSSCIPPAGRDTVRLERSQTATKCSLTI